MKKNNNSKYLTANKQVDVNFSLYMYFKWTNLRKSLLI